VASIPITGGHSLCPVKIGEFDKIVDQNSFSIYYLPPNFHWENYTLNKTPPIFQSAPLTKIPPLFFTRQSTPLTKLSH